MRLRYLGIGLLIGLLVGAPAAYGIVYNPGGGGSGAGTGLSYVTISAEATLAAERQLQGTTNQVVVTDGGANTTVTLSTPQDLDTGADLQVGSLGVGTAAPGTAGDLTINDQLVVSGAGPHAIGGATDANFQLSLSGSFSGGLSSLRLNPSLSPSANQSGSILRVDGTLVEASSGTHVDFTGAQFRAPTITGGVAALTNATTVKIDAAPTGATNNYAFWVDTGLSRFDGDIDMTAGAFVHFNEGAPAAGDCNAAAEEGRITVDITNGIFYVCDQTGATTGWATVLDFSS